jgi:hypothetical protein
VPAGAEPFRIQRFDPISLFVLEAGEAAQANFITLMGPSGSVALSNPAFSRDSFDGTVALTVSAGRHPLSDGIRRITIVGLQGAPRVDRVGGTLTVEGGGLRIELRGAEARAEGETVWITVPAPSLPETASAVPLEDGIHRHDREILLKSLRDEQAVERVAVVEWQGGHPGRVLELDGQGLEPVRGDLLGKEAIGPFATTLDSPRPTKKGGGKRERRRGATGSSPPGMSP